MHLLIFTSEKRVVVCRRIFLCTLTAIILIGTMSELEAIAEETGRVAPPSMSKLDGTMVFGGFQISVSLP